MKHKSLLFAILHLFPLLLSAQVTITESAGWLESAFVKWTTTANTDSFNVYFSGEGLTNVRIDDKLIRKYETYYRADVPGLTAGNYSLKVVPIVDKSEAQGAETNQITVLQHNRTGFAFSGSRVPGAYKSDGTPKDGAVILYVTEKTKNTISLNVTGASSNPCVGLQTILDGFKKGKDTRPLIVRLVGQITDFAVMYNGDIVVENTNNAASYITLEGIGDDAVADGWGIRLKNASNIEVRNIGLMNCNSGEGDNIGLQQNNDHIWVHNCDFFYGDAGSDADQVKGDGALDCKLSKYVTFSYNHFWDSGKCNLLGLSETISADLLITYHHNWYDHSDSRHPRVRFYSAHVFNNYYDGNAKYGVGATCASSVFVESNYFRNCNYPMLTSMQGSDVWTGTKNDYSTMPTFSKEDGGTIKAFNNYITGATRLVAYNDTNFNYTAAGVYSTVDFDAYFVANRNDIVPDSVKSSYGKNTYNNFDTNSSIMYSYTVDSPEEAKANVMAYSGRVNGGDFKWTFDNSVDDEADAVNTALKTALADYTTKLVSIQGEDTANTGGNNEEPPTGSMVQNFTASGTASTFYTIAGNLSTSYGTASYAGLNLTQCLKMESSTNISFTTTESGTLTLVFGSSYSATVKIDGTARTPVSGILTLTLDAGAHTIVKGSGSNYLFYMSVEYNTGIRTIAEITKPIIYPNPVKNTFSILSGETIRSVSIYTIQGVLLQKTIQHTKTIDISPLPAGSYFVKIITNKGSYMEKILKK